MRVLFVEDNDDVRELTGEVLDDEGVDFVACASAEQAELAFAAGGFDLLLTDVSLPRMSGTDLARRLLAQRPDLWVVFLSGYALGKLDGWAPRVRAMLKPFESEQLQALLDEVRASLQPAG